MMDRDDLELFERSVRSATERCSGTDLDAALAELGWAEALEVDAHAAVSSLFRLQGLAGATSNTLGAVVASQFQLRDAPATVAVPALASTAPPGRIEDGTLVIDGLATQACRSHPTAAVVVEAGDGFAVANVALDALVVRDIAGIDPALGLVEVHGTVALNTVELQPLATGSWDDAVAACRIALGYELVGASRAMLAQAREHALERIQFGQPISQFQAIRHRLAETYIAIETAEALLEGWWLDPTETNASMAKSLAGRCARIAARHCQQVLAGIGFTTEHPLHLFIRRALVLDELFGSSRALTRELGADLIASRSLPPLLSL